MPDDNEISQLHIKRQMQDRQKRVRFMMDRENLPLTTVSKQTGIPYSSLLGYFPKPKRDLLDEEPPDPTIMPITVLVKLFGVIPDDWLSILTEPEGRVFSKSAEDESTLAELDKMAAAIERLRLRVVA